MVAPLSYQPHRAPHPKLQFEMASYNEPEYFARAEKSGHIIVRGIEQILRLYSELLRLFQIPRSSTSKHTSPTIEVTPEKIISKMTREGLTTSIQAELASSDCYLLDRIPPTSISKL